MGRKNCYKRDPKSNRRKIYHTLEGYRKERERVTTVGLKIKVFFTKQKETRKTRGLNKKKTNKLITASFLMFNVKLKKKVAEQMFENR